MASGATKRVYAGIYGSGVWMSDDGGASWSSIYPGTNPVRAAMGKDSTLMVSLGGDEGGRTGAVILYQGGNWKPVLTADDGYAGVAFDPGNPLKIVAAANHDQTIYASADQGNSWTNLGIAGAPNQPAYYATNSFGQNSAKAAGWGNGVLAIDPVQPKRLLQTNGYGVIATEDYTAASTSWSWWMNNLEELVVQNVKVPPLAAGADLFSVVADMVGFRHASRNAAPGATIASFQYVAQATSVAYCATKPQYSAFVGWDETNQSAAMTGFSSDNGQTWKPFGSVTPGSGGIIAMSATDPMNMVWAPAGANPQYSTDGGRSWKPSQLSGGGNLPASWQLSNIWWTGQVLAADQVQGGTFYYYYERGNVYSSADGGATWTQVSSNPNLQWTIKVNLIPNPAKAGDLWIALSRNTNQTALYPLLHSTDGGKTFTPVAGIAQCNFVAVGKGNSAGAPFLYVHGRDPAATADAIYKSEDLGATWVRVSDPSLNQFGNITALEGDLRMKDLVYVGTGGRGIFHGYDPASGLAAPSFTAPGVGSAADYRTGSIVPGEIVAIFGAGMGPSTLAGAQLDETGFVSDDIAGTQVLFNGVPGPIVYSRADVVSAVVPYGVAGHDSVLMQVASNDSLSAPVAMAVVAGAPGIFTDDSSGKGQAVAWDYTQAIRNSAAHPAKKGDLLIVYVTGDGQTQPAGLDGWVVGLPLPYTALATAAEIGGVQVAPGYAGGAYSAVSGVSQYNITVPQNAPSGAAVPLRVTAGGVASQAGVTIAIE